MNHVVVKADTGLIQVEGNGVLRNGPDRCAAS